MLLDFSLFELFDDLLSEAWPIDEGGLGFCHFTLVLVDLLNQRLHVVDRSWRDLQDLLYELLRIFTLDDNGENELNHDEKLIDVLLLDQLLHVDNVLSELATCLIWVFVRLEPQLHLLEHALVCLLEVLGFLS